MLKIQKLYKKYLKNNVSYSDLIKLFEANIPEIVYRTTRLSGENVTRKQVFKYLTKVVPDIYNI